MIRVVFSNINRFIIFTLLQVLIIQNINFGTYFVPMAQVIIILLLPLQLERVWVLLICFFVGLTLDPFYNQQGLHSAAMVFLGFLRPFVLKAIAPREGYEDFMKPTVQSMGIAWFATYSGLLIFGHHLFFFYLEIFRFNEFWSTMLRVLCSSVATFVLILILQYLFYRNEKTVV
ncbi:MAG: Rod shape-determining protein MreD [Bacteroidia bacterium]|nr:Rod shape-determining protein MreD [Bacteroidia bacterium]